MKEMILMLGVLFVAKTIDALLNTSKTLFIQRNKGWLAACMIVGADIIYYTITKTVVSSSGYASILAVAFASGFGCLLAVSINKKLSKDRMYAHIIMSSDLEEMKALRDFLAINHITNIATDCYTLDWEQKTISVTAYAETKHESKLIDDYLKNNDTKFKRVIQTN